MGVRVLAIANEPPACGAEGCQSNPPSNPPPLPRVAGAVINEVFSLTQQNGEALDGVPVGDWAAAVAEDGEYLVTASSNIDGGWDGQILRFNVTLPESGLARLTVLWRGYGEPVEGYPVRLEVYNLLTDQWELERTRQTQAIGSNVELTLTITNSFERYVAGDGSLWVRVRADNLELYPPSNVQARAAASNEARLSWVDGNSGEDGYIVEREILWLPGIRETMATLPANSTAYTDLGGSLIRGQGYRYSVSAYRGGLTSEVATADATLPAAGKRSGATVNVPADAASIQEAVNLAQPGDTVVVAVGQYAETVAVRTGNLTIRGAGIGASIITGVPYCAEEFCAAVTITTKSIQPVTVTGFTLTGGFGTLIGGARLGGGVLVDSSAATLRKLDVSRNHVPGGGANGSALAFVNPLPVTVENVAAYINLGDHGAAVYVAGGSDSLVLRHLTVFGNGTGDGQVVRPRGLEVLNRYGAASVISSIFWNNGTGDELGADIPRNLEVSHTIYRGSLSRATDLGGNFSEDPLIGGFDNAHLQLGSPAIDRARSFGAPGEDYEGYVRPNGLGYDIGASEYQTGGKSGGSKASLEVAVAEPSSFYWASSRPTSRATAASRAEYQPRHASLNTDLIDTEVVEVTAPAAPQNFVAFGIQATELSLRWTDSASDEEGFTVYRDGAVVVNVGASSGIGGSVIFTDYGADLPTHSLAPGQTYCYVVSAYREGVEGYSAQVCATTLTAAGAAPAAPTGLTAAGFSATQINLSWTDHADDPDGEEGFNVYRRVGSDAEGNPYVLVNSPVAAFPGTGTVVFSDRGLDLPEHELATSTTYCYRVAAYNRFAESARSDEGCGQVLPETLIRAYQFGGEFDDVPRYDEGAHVLDLNDMAFVSEQSCGSPCTLLLETNFSQLFAEDADFDLNGVYNSQLFVIHLDTPPEGLSSLDLEWRGRGETRPDHWVRLALYSFDTDTWVPQLEQNIEAPLTFTTSTPSARLRRFVGEVNGRQHTVLLWVRGRAYIPPPAAPTNLRVTALSPTGVALAWDDEATTETEYVVSRAADDLMGTWSEIAALPANTTSFTDTVPVATDWRYHVAARQRTLTSDQSNDVQVSTPLYLPKDVNVVAIDSSRIRVAWNIDLKNPPLGIRASIERYRGIDDPLAPWEEVHETAAGETSWTDSGLEPKTFYSYRVRHKATDGARTRESAYSSVVYTSTPDVSAPAAPTDLAATQVLPNQVNLGWKDNASNETTYVVERQNKLTGTWQTVIDSLPPNTQSFGDTGLQPGVTYSYRVKAHNAVGDSPYSNQITVTTPGSEGSFTVRSALPPRNGSSQGMAVLASHGGYVYAASSDVDLGPGKEPWRHLNVWRSTDGGDRSPWEWVGETAQDVSNNVPAAMVSYKGVLVLVTGSNVWSSPNDGATWTLRLGKGIGSWQLNGFHTHLTVYDNTVYALLEGGVLYKTTNGLSWSGVGVPSGAQALAQWNGKLVTYADEGARLTRVYAATPDVSSWVPLGNLLEGDLNPDCDRSNGFIGVGPRLYVGGSGTIPPYTRCLRVSQDGYSWLRVKTLDVGPGVVFPGSTAIIGTNYVVPAPAAAFIDGSNGNVSAVPVSGLSDGSRMWSVVNFNGSVLATAFKPSGGEPGAVLIYGNP